MEFRCGTVAAAGGKSGMLTPLKITSQSFTLANTYADMGYCGSLTWNTTSSLVAGDYYLVILQITSATNFTTAENINFNYQLSTIEATF